MDGLDSEGKGDKMMISSSRVTLLTNLPVAENVKDAAGETLKKYARL